MNRVYVQLMLSFHRAQQNENGNENSRSRVKEEIFVPKLVKRALKFTDHCSNCLPNT